MTQEQFDMLDYLAQITLALQENDCLDEECYCVVISENENHEVHPYTLTINGNYQTTEYSVYTWFSETPRELDDILEEYGVYDWTDLPIRRDLGCCRICPERYNCDNVSRAVQIFRESLPEKQP